MSAAAVVMVVFGVIGVSAAVMVVVVFNRIIHVVMVADADVNARCGAN